MKKVNLFLGAAIIAIGFTSCKSEGEKQAEMAFDSYEKYVDSVTTVNAEEAKVNWESIEASYNERTAEAEAALESVGDRNNAQARLEKAQAKYAEMKAKMEAETAAAQAEAPATGKQAIRDAYFGAGKIGEDMNFSWVNKDNILRVYNDFYNKFDENKDNYSREDFDEIKALYEALDSRKNTVEKEGLSSKDNRKIAELKFKFGPKFKWNRMDAKAEENAEAKE